MAKLPTSNASKEDYERAVGSDGLDLFSPGGSFQCYPGPILVTGRNGLVLAANDPAEPIVELLQRGGSAELREAVNAALEGKVAQINPLLLAAEDGRPGIGVAYDLSVLPWGGGAAALVVGRDVTLDRSLRSALIESRQRYKDLVEAACDFAWETDAQGRFTFVSAEGALGYAAGELVGGDALALHLESAEGQDSPFTTREPVREVELWVRNAEGAPACLRATALPLTGPDGRFCGARGLCRNVTAARSHEASLAGDRHRKRLLSYILGIVRDEMEPAHMLQAAAGALVPALPASGAGIFRRGPDGGLALVAQAGELPPEDRLVPLLQGLGAAGEEMERQFGGALFGKTTHVQDEANGVLCLWRRDAIGPWADEDRFLLAEIAAQLGLALRQLSREEELETRSSTDPLTGLLNRRAFTETLEQRYRREIERAYRAALFYVDLDNFKQVNDRHGHQQGDLALSAVARILLEQLRSRDLVARLGGDEFALLIEEITPAAAEQKGRDLLAASADLKALSGDPEHPLGLSIGIAVCDPRRREGLAELMARADRAMYQVKHGGKGGLVVLLPPEVVESVS